jgi:hypothetical protein
MILLGLAIWAFTAGHWIVGTLLVFHWIKTDLLLNVTKMVTSQMGYFNMFTVLIIFVLFWMLDQ